MAFCINCGEKIKDGAKFCNECGAPVVESGSKRRISYEGEMHKCLNCGEILQSFVTNCPACGYELRGTKASTTVSDFAWKLAQMENNSAKVTFIRNIPIPNNKEDIFEFMILASTNFDANFSNVGSERKEISDAWISKIEQGYQKAKLLFGNDTEFSKIQKMYDQVYSKINASLQKEKKNSIFNLALRTIGLWGGLIVFVIAFFMDISTHSNTSIYHLGGGTIMIIGSIMIGRKSKEITDVGVGVLCGILSILLGTILQDTFNGNGSAMELAGGATIIISMVRLVQSTSRRN